MLGWTTTVATAAAVLAIPLLVVAGTTAVLRGPGSPRARVVAGLRPLPAVAGVVASVVLVVAVAAVGLVAASRGDARSALPPLALGTGAAVLLVRPDRRLWQATALLLPPGLVAATVLTRALGHVYVSDSGTWAAARLLVAAVGPAGNPVDPRHADAVTALVTLGLALPWAVAIASAWRATRPGVGGLERVALLLAVVACGVGVATTGATSLALVVGGARLGVPLPLLLVGLLAALVLALPVATAAGAALAVLPWVRELPDLLRLEPQEDLEERRRPAQDASLRSVGSFAAGHAPWARHLFVVAAVLGVLGVTALSLGQRSLSGDPRAHEVDYVRVADETPLTARAAAVVAGPSGATWVLTRDERLVALDPATGAYGAASVPAVSVTPLPGAAGALVVTPGSLPQLLLVTDLARPVPVTGFGRGTTVSVAAGPASGAGAGTSYAVDSAGTAVVVGHGGTVAKVVHLDPSVAVAVRGADVWTLSRSGDVATGEQWTAVRHRAGDLAELARTPATRAGSVVSWGDPAAPIRWDLALGRFVDPRTPDRGWLERADGAVDRVTATGSTTYRLPYDRVAGVVTTGGATWAVVDDDGSSAVRSTARSYVVRWADPLPSS